MTTLQDQQHDENEHAFRNALAQADRIKDPIGREVAREAIAAFYDFIRRRIERSLYSSEEHKTDAA